MKYCPDCGNRLEMSEDGLTMECKHCSFETPVLEKNEEDIRMQKIRSIRAEREKEHIDAEHNRKLAKRLAKISAAIFVISLLLWVIICLKYNSILALVVIVGLHSSYVITNFIRTLNVYRVKPFDYIRASMLTIVAIALATTYVQSFISISDAEKKSPIEIILLFSALISMNAVILLVGSLSEEFGKTPEERKKEKEEADKKAEWERLNKQAEREQRRADRRRERMDKYK